MCVGVCVGVGVLCVSVCSCERKRERERERERKQNGRSRLPPRRRHYQGIPRGGVFRYPSRPQNKCCKFYRFHLAGDVTQKSISEPQTLTPEGVNNFWAQDSSQGLQHHVLWRAAFNVWPRVTVNEKKKKHTHHSKNANERNHFFQNILNLFEIILNLLILVLMAHTQYQTRIPIHAPTPTQHPNITPSTPFPKGARIKKKTPNLLIHPTFHQSQDHQSQDSK